MSQVVQVIPIEEEDPLLPHHESSKKDKALTEEKLKETPLTIHEANKMPSFSNSWNSFFSGFAYAPYSLFFGLKHLIYCKMSFEFAVFFIAVGLIIGGSIGLAFLFWYLIGSEIDVFKLLGENEVVYIVVYILFIVFVSLGLCILIFICSKFVFHWFYNQACTRISVMVEHIMRGQKQRISPCYFMRGGCSLWEIIKKFIIEGIIHLAKEIFEWFITTVLWPAVLSFLHGIPIFGQVCYVILVSILYLAKFGLSNMKIVFKRKEVNYFKTFKYVYDHLAAVCGFGLGTLFMYLIPGVNVLYYFFGDIAGTRLYVHLEEREKIKNKMSERITVADQVIVNGAILSQQPQVVLTPVIVNPIYTNQVAQFQNSQQFPNNVQTNPVGVVNYSQNLVEEVPSVPDLD